MKEFSPGVRLRTDMAFELTRGALRGFGLSLRLRRGERSGGEIWW